MGLSMIELLRKKQTLLSKKTTRPLNISVEHHSDLLAFSINPAIVSPNGYILAIRVQDIARQKWFEYNRDTGWSESPEVTVGTGTLYIAAYAKNLGGNGNLRLIINDSSKVLVDKSDYVVSGGNFGAETGTINMPDTTYNISVSVTP
jgi:hypothetical protein